MKGFIILNIAGLPPLKKTRGYTPGKVYRRSKTKAQGWSAKNDIKEFPTNAFGHIKFVNAYNSSLKPSKVYVKLSKSYVIDQSDEFLLLADDISERCLAHTCSCFVFLVLFGQSWR